LTDAPALHGHHARIGTWHNRLRGKTALITGSTRGLGRTTAEWLAREGASIYVSGRKQEDVEATIAAIEMLGVKAWGSPADLAKPEEAHALATRALETAGPFDILVNNAGMSQPQSFLDVTDAEWETELNTNVRSPFILSQHLAREMIAHGIRGRIVNISTIGVFAAHKQQMVYNIAKGGVQAMTRCMAWELGHHGISANCVAPGAVPERPGSQEQIDAGAFRIWNERIPMGRLGRAEDIAAAVVFFCLPESEWTTGQTLLVDGGHISYLRED
jgi:NAD(P)-dependent dehydrogenase (short-subunit alcohol dehydrogenase family)